MTHLKTFCLFASMAALAAGPVLAQGHGDRDARLLWAPPPLDHPITIQLGAGQTYNRLDDAKDYVIKLPKTKKVGTTMLEGGHNIVIIGGHITLPETADKSNAALSRAIYIKNNVGVVHIEGVLIDGSGGGMSDGIDISAPQSIVQIENVRVDGIYGYSDQFHADVVQTFGGFKELRIDKLTGYSAYQGLTIGIDRGPNGAAEINRANLVAIHDQMWGPHNNGGFMIWMTADNACQKIFPIRLRQVYVQPRNGSSLANAVWPPATARTACPAKVAGDDSEARFPAIPVTGRIRKGLPPGGDFVPAGVAGIDYVSPGYREGRGDLDD